MTYSASDALHWSTGGVLKLLRRFEGFSHVCLFCGALIEDGHAPECELGWTIRKLEHEVLDRPGTPSRTFEPPPAPQEEPPTGMKGASASTGTNNGAADSLGGARSDGAA